MSLEPSAKGEMRRPRSRSPEAMANLARATPRPAAEKRGAGELFELADLLGNGARRDVQLFGGAGEGQVAGGRLEGAQGVESGQAVFLGHFA